MPCGFHAPKTLTVFGFPIMSSLSGPHEGYSRNVPYALNLISKFLLNKALIEDKLQSINPLLCNRMLLFFNKGLNLALE